MPLVRTVHDIVRVRACGMMRMYVPETAQRHAGMAMATPQGSGRAGAVPKPGKGAAAVRGVHRRGRRPHGQAYYAY